MRRPVRVVVHMPIYVRLEPDDWDIETEGLCPEVEISGPGRVVYALGTITTRALVAGELEQETLVRAITVEAKELAGLLGDEIAKQGSLLAESIGQGLVMTARDRRWRVA